MTSQRPEDPKDDPFSRVDYRRMVAWPQRLQREAPLLREVLGRAPEASVLDLGCGTGEHSRFFAEAGARVVGLDRSESMIEKAADSPLPPNLTFVLGDIVEVTEVTVATYGLAISLGNTLVNITEDDGLAKSLRGLNESLCNGGLFLLQILNYERIIAQKIRHLPLNFREGEEGEVVFLRLMEHVGNGRIRFCPTSLAYRPHDDPPVKVVQSRVVEVRGWKREEMTTQLEGAGFQIESLWGDMEQGPYDPATSSDLVILARKTRTAS